MKTILQFQIMLAACCVAVLSGPLDRPAWEASARDVAPRGWIYVPRETRVARIDASTGEASDVPLLGEGPISDVAAALTGSRFAVSRLARRPGGALGRDILVLPTEGGAIEHTVEHDSPRVFLGNPAFSANGALVYFDRQDASRPPSESSIERVDLVSMERRVIATNARAPSVHPNGESVAFLRWGTSETLIVKSLTDESETITVGPNGFLAIASPRFSPDGQWIAFAAVSEITARPAATKPGEPRSMPAFRARPPQHGFPWEIWRVRPDGSELERITDIAEDEPTPAWSPDGRSLAVFGGLGLTVIDLDESRRARILGAGGFGGIGWMPAQAQP